MSRKSKVMDRDALKKEAFAMLEKVYFWLNDADTGLEVGIVSGSIAVSDRDWSLGVYGALDGRPVYHAESGRIGFGTVEETCRRFQLAQWQFVAPWIDVDQAKLDKPQ